MGRKVTENPKTVTLCGSPRFVDIMAVSPYQQSADHWRRLQTFGQGRQRDVVTDARGVQLVLSDFGAKERELLGRRADWFNEAEGVEMQLILGQSLGAQYGSIGDLRTALYFDASKSSAILCASVSERPVATTFDIAQSTTCHSHTMRVVFVTPKRQPSNSTSDITQILYFVRPVRTQRATASSQPMLSAMPFAIPTWVALRLQPQ